MDDSLLFDQGRMPEGYAKELLAAAVNVAVADEPVSRLDASAALRQVAANLENHPADAARALAVLAKLVAHEVECTVNAMGAVPQDFSLNELLTDDTQANYYVRRFLQLSAAVSRFGRDSQEATSERAAIIRSVERSENQPAAVAKGAEVLAMRLAIAEATPTSGQKQFGSER